MRQKHISKTGQLELMQRSSLYMDENTKLLRKYKLRVELVVNFKKYIRHIPLLSRIALWVIHMQGGFLDMAFRKDEDNYSGKK